MQAIVQRIRDENPVKKLKPVSEVTALVIDNGHFFELARTLARSYKKVYYYCPNISEGPKINKSMIGYGYEEIELAHDFYGKPYDESDLIVFPDVGQGDMQVEMAKTKAVWGAKKAEDLEFDREGTKKLLKKIGMPVGPYEVVTGIEALREYLKTHKDVYVKISKYRGMFESFLSSNYLSVETDIDDLCQGLGMFKHVQRFVCEDALPDKVELGMDCYTVDGEWPESCLGGIEIKNKGYVGAFKKWSEFPKPLTELNEKLSPYLKEKQMRGSMSTEGRIGEDGKFYTIDFTQREPSPPGELRQEIYTNTAEIIWEGANGVMVNPKPAGKFGVEINMASDNRRRGKWQEISYPKEFERNVKLHSPCIIKGRKYVIQTDWETEVLGGVSAWGNTLEDAVKQVKKIVKEVKGPTLEMDTENIIELAGEQLEKADKFGVAMI